MNSINNILEIQKNQNRIENKIRILQNEINNIEEDIYIMDDNECDCECDKMHDNDYEFEITCPYCNYEFLTDSSHQNQTEIKCPKCQKIIELDWNSNCIGECNNCKDHCYDENKVAEQNDEYKLDEDNDEDDM